MNALGTEPIDLAALEALHKAASPARCTGPDAVLIAAARNALPELLRLARIGQEAERARADHEHAREGGTEMRRLGTVAEDVLRCALAWEPSARLIGNVTAKEMAMLVARIIDTCPKCGSTAWANIDCDLCGVCSAIEKEANRG